MNRFRFRLDSVLRVRAAEETKKKREFGAALQHVRNAEARLRGTLDEIEANDRLAEEKGRGTTTAAELKSLSGYSRVLERKKAAQKKVLERTEETLRLTREELVEATRRKKTIERLRERALLAHEQAVRKEEQAIIDETAVQKFARSISSGDSPA